MKTNLLVLSALLAAQSVFAGGGQESHGGIGFVCGEDTSRHEFSVSLLDFAEARIGDMRLTFFNGEKKSEKSSLTDAIERLQTNTVNPGIGKIFADQVLKGIGFFERDKFFLNPFVRLPLDLSDTLPKFEIQRCKLGQIANYSTNSSLYIVKDYFERMKEIEKAGLKVHEAIYKIVRQTKQLTSTKPIRELTALLFSDERDDKAIYELMTALMYQGDGIDITQKTKYSPSEAQEYVDYILNGKSLHCTTMDNKGEVVFKSNKLKNGNRRIEQSFPNDSDDGVIFIGTEYPQIKVDPTDEKYGVILSATEGLTTSIAFNEGQFENLLNNKTGQPPKLHTGFTFRRDESQLYADSSPIKCWLR